MSLLEMVIAMLMLILFTSVVVSVLELTARFLGEVESGNDVGQPVQDQSANGALIELQEIQVVFDQIVEVLAQPGISKGRLLGASNQRRIAYPLGENPSVACTSPLDRKGLLDLNTAWNLSGPSLRFSDFPAGYSICLWQTSLAEASIKELATNAWPANKKKAGLYVLQALPQKLDAATLPTRRLFCRPRPYCAG
ncbi:hypothetical protein [Synechococcus sp. GEYO]|uniref:hypothetical protein n=1 Tax=Synechococcus sp. GEYO TaxID=2575511 RepID=UPI000E0FD5C2|nr:hypothetical protein [Synechococcus sp. GEYO]